MKGERIKALLLFPCRYCGRDVLIRKMQKFTSRPAFWCKCKKKLFFAKICCKFLQISCFFKVFCSKNAENDYFDQHLECTATKRWSKYTTTRRERRFSDNFFRLVQLVLGISVLDHSAITAGSLTFFSKKTDCYLLGTVNVI